MGLFDANRWPNRWSARSADMQVGHGHGLRCVVASRRAAPHNPRMSLHLDHDFTINPDGSGKAKVRWAGPLGERSPTAEEFLTTELERAHGVDTWCDVTCGPQGDEMVFAGTAYFSDLGELHFHCQGFRLHALDLALTSGDDGAVAVASRLRDRTPSPNAPHDASDAEHLAAMPEERSRLEQARGFVAAMFGAIHCVIMLRMPGTLAETCPGERPAPNALRVEFRGSDLLAAIDRLLTDDALMLQVMRQGGATPETVSGLLGDGGGPIRARTRPGARAQFDYAAEVEAARARFAEQRASLGLPEPPRQGTALQNVRVVAVKVVHEVDGARDLNPAGQNYTSTTLTLAGDLESAALGIDEGKIAAITARDGTDLTPDDEWQRRIHFPKLTSDGRSVWFDVEFGRERAAVDGFAAVLGTLQVRSAHGARDVDLGLAELTAGAQGTELGAEITRCDVTDDDSWTLELTLRVARETVLAMTLLTKDGSLALTYGGYSASGDECSLHYTIPGAPPPDARLVATVPESLRVATVPFALGPVDALGRPRPES